MCGPFPSFRRSKAPEEGVGTPSSVCHYIFLRISPKAKAIVKTIINNLNSLLTRIYGQWSAWKRHDQLSPMSRVSRLEWRKRPFINPKDSRNAVKTGAHGEKEGTGSNERKGVPIEISRRKLSAAIVRHRLSVRRGRKMKYEMKRQDGVGGPRGGADETRAPRAAKGCKRERERERERK
ncbi:hypothetical protein ALC56_08382 [Trachymyrmex septentrionalis]|uniref:Uncharacterized protein n=1 Tax=Trachymyrmex septentrionalis TaxID=34720 RepID=A0A195FBA8_9HYME|nr:hypothetical protein ALC56_08382 [Trachymyrmex septentrionalis]